MNLHPTRPLSLASLALIGALAVGCSAPEPPPAPAPGAGAGTVAAEFEPITVESCGQKVEISKKPERIVAFDGAATTLFALKASDQMVAYYGTPADQMPDDLGAEAGRLEYRGSTFPAPTLEVLLQDSPDLVLLYGEYEQKGITQARLAELDVPAINLSEGCKENADPTLEGYYSDVEKLGKVVGKADEARSLVAGWRERVEAVQPKGEKRRVLIHGNMDPSSVFASSGRSFAGDQLRVAGGENIYEDAETGYLEPSWEDVAKRDPEIIIDGSGGLEESNKALKEYLGANDALANMSAVRDGRIVSIPYQENIPGPQAIDGIEMMAKVLGER